jgi:hypothetical protein
VSWLKRLLFGNLPLKAYALLSALALWLYVDTIVSDSRIVSIPVQIRAPQGASVRILDEAATADTIQARVTFRGPKDTVSLLTPQAVRGEVVLPASATEGTSVVPLTVDSFLLPDVQDLIVVRVEPSSVTVEVGRSAPRQE